MNSCTDTLYVTDHAIQRYRERVRVSMEQWLPGRKYSDEDVYRQIAAMLPRLLYAGSNAFDPDTMTKFVIRGGSVVTVMAPRYDRQDIRVDQVITKLNRPRYSVTIGTDHREGVCGTVDDAIAYIARCIRSEQHRTCGHGCVFVRAIVLDEPRIIASCQIHRTAQSFSGPQHYDHQDRVHKRWSICP